MTNNPKEKEDVINEEELKKYANDPEVMGEDSVEPSGNMDLDELINSTTWDALVLLHKETLTDIHGQIALVNELKNQYIDNMDSDIEDAFNGLILSLRDLIKETIEIGVSHAESTEIVKVGGESKDSIEVSKEFYSGELKDSDDAMAYVNSASRYVNVQDKTVSLISLGWVDLFVKLKLPTEELTTTIKNGIKAAKNDSE